MQWCGRWLRRPTDSALGCPPMLGELAEGEALAGLALLPGFWSSTGAETNVPCKGGKVWTKIDDKWRERKIIPEGKGMHKCHLQGGKSR